MTTCHIMIGRSYMPSQTYFNLPKEKQDALIKAAIHEFSKVSYYDASINKMIKEAGIPRGSFYVYFKDKEDLYEYVLSRHFEKMKVEFISILEKNQGDIFKTLEVFFSHILSYMKLHEQNLFKNAFLNLSYVRSYHWQNTWWNMCDKKRNIEEILVLMDQTRLNVQKEEDLIIMLEMLFMIVTKNLVAYILFAKNEKEAKEQFCRHLALLQQGFIKKEDL